MEDGKLSDKDIRKINKNFRLVLILQIVIIIFLLTSTLLLYFGFFSRDAVIDAGDGIDLSIESVSNSSIEYNVEIGLKNTGNKLAMVSVTGEVYISELYSATGDEMTKILEYKYVEITSGQTKNLNLGTFPTFEGWHYVVKVHVSWNGGSLELSKMLIPSP